LLAFFAAQRLLDHRETSLDLLDVGPLDSDLKFTPITEFLAPLTLNRSCHCGSFIHSTPISTIRMALFPAMQSLRYFMIGARARVR
jgi:hypothetical protein